MSRPASPDAGEHPPGKTIDGGQPSPTGAEVSEGRGPVSRGMSRDPQVAVATDEETAGSKTGEVAAVSQVGAQPTVEGRGETKMAGGQTPREEQSKHYVKYTFFKVSRDWRFLEPGSREKARAEFHAALKDGASDITLGLFSLVGIRGDTDFMITAESASLEPFQSLVSKLLSTQLGRYLEIPYSYLAMTRRSRYIGAHKHAGQEGTSEGAGGEGGQQQKPEAGSRYLFVYPFTKKREWYRLAFTERQRSMAEHFKIGHKYPRIKINTGYSFGLDDQEFMLAFEGDDPSEFLALVEELRSSDASMYTQMETPIFTCVRVGAERMLELLG